MTRFLIGLLAAIGAGMCCTVIFQMAQALVDGQTIVTARGGDVMRTVMGLLALFLIAWALTVIAGAIQELTAEIKKGREGE